MVDLQEPPCRDFAYANVQFLNVAQALIRRNNVKENHWFG